MNLSPGHWRNDGKQRPGLFRRTTGLPAAIGESMTGYVREVGGQRIGARRQRACAAGGAASAKSSPAPLLLLAGGGGNTVRGGLTHGAPGSPEWPTSGGCASSLLAAWLAGAHQRRRVGAARTWSASSAGRSPVWTGPLTGARGRHRIARTAARKSAPALHGHSLKWGSIFGCCV